MDLGFKLQYIYCWLCFIKEYNKPLYLTDTIVLESLNSIRIDNELLYFSSELELIQCILDNDELWMEIMEMELDMSIEDYFDESFTFSESPE